MFIQVIQGQCRDADRLRELTRRVARPLGPTAEGWLGGTYGVTDDGQFVAVVRFESREAAATNSDRPEQGEWWQKMEACFDGEVTFHDCDDVIDVPRRRLRRRRLRPDHPGPADRCGAVPGLHDAADGRAARGPSRDPRRHHRDRADGTFTETVAFRSEAAGPQRARPRRCPTTCARRRGEMLGDGGRAATSTCTTRGSPRAARGVQARTWPRGRSRAAQQRRLGGVHVGLGG